MPVPVTFIVVLLFSVSVHAPIAVTLPVILVLAPVQIAVFALVIATVGRAFTLTVVVPVKLAAVAGQFASVKEASV